MNKLPNYRISKTDKQGQYVSREYRSFKNAQAQVLIWMQELDLVTGDKLSITVEVL